MSAAFIVPAPTHAMAKLRRPTAPDAAERKDG